MTAPPRRPAAGRATVAAVLIGLAGACASAPGGAQVAAAPPSRCALDEAPEVVRADGAARLLRWELDDRPVLFSPALPDDPGYAAFRQAIRADGAELRAPIADRAPAADAATAEVWRREDANAALVLSGRVGQLRPIHCLEALVFARQHARYSQLTAPTEVMVLVLRRGEGATARLRIYVGASDQLFPPKTVYGLTEATADVAAGWRLEVLLHNHTIQHRGARLALGMPTLSTADVQLFRNLVTDLGLRSAWVTNGAYTVEVPAADFSRFQARD